MTTTTRLRLVWSGARLGHAGRASDSIIGIAMQFAYFPPAWLDPERLRAVGIRLYACVCPIIIGLALTGLTTTLAATA